MYRGEEMEEKYAGLREAVDKAEIVDAHAHNIVALHSSVPFLNCFSEATGDALSFAPHTLSFKVISLSLSPSPSLSLSLC